MGCKKKNEKQKGSAGFKNHANHLFLFGGRHRIEQIINLNKASFLTTSQDYTLIYTPIPKSAPVRVSTGRLECSLKNQARGLLHPRKIDPEPPDSKNAGRCPFRHYLLSETKKPAGAGVLVGILSGQADYLSPFSHIVCRSNATACRLTTRYRNTVSKSSNAGVHNN